MFWRNKKKGLKAKRQEKLEELYCAVKEMMGSLQIRHHAANQSGYRTPAHLLLPQVKVDSILEEIQFMEQDF